MDLIHHQTLRTETATVAMVPLKWAYEAQTAEPRYIHDQEVVQGACKCTCPAFKLSLIPVMVDRSLRARPAANFLPFGRRHLLALDLAYQFATRYATSAHVTSVPAFGSASCLLGHGPEAALVLTHRPAGTGGPSEHVARGMY